MRRRADSWRWAMIGAASAAIVMPTTVPELKRLAASSASSAKRHPHGQSGIWGTVSSGGPCGSGRPIKATQRARSQNDGHAVTEFSSSDDGTFEVELRPGSYLIEQRLDQVRRGQGGFLHPALVAVPKGSFVEVNLWYDNGMRLPC